MHKYFLTFTLLFITLFASLAQDYTEYNHETILSFEQMPVNLFCDKNSTLTVTDKHFKHLEKSLEWCWGNAGATWGIGGNIGYTAPKTANDSYVSTFVFWIYAKAAISGKKLKVEFLKQGEVQCWFEYGLDFTGWRGAWIAFDRDMQGTPVEGMNEVRFSVPDVKEGLLFFDHIILSSMQDVRHHTADFQAPYINEGTENHWLVLQQVWEADFDFPGNRQIADNEINDALEIAARTEAILLREKKAKPISQLRKWTDAYQIKQNQDGTVKGLPVFFERYGETYEMLGAARYNILFNNRMGLKKFNDLLLDLAVTYHQSENRGERDEIAAMFVLLIRHILDQGFQAGSAMGTLHHLGYSMRDFYSAAFLMSDPLKKAGLKHTVQQAMEWFSGTGDLKTAPTEPGMDIDTFNTNLIARLTTVLMIDQAAKKNHYLHAFSRWINNGYAYAEGTRGSFKIDGTIFHHRHHYPAYAIGGLSGAVEAVYLLRGTEFSISERSHNIVKQALLNMRFYCNLRTWPLSLSGRHLDGVGQLDPLHFGLLAMAGTPGGAEKIDPELATAFLRLAPGESSFTRELEEAGFHAEKSPEGNRTFSYSNLNVHRRDNWMVSVMGHSRYLWSTEGYRGENLFGRYLNHGALQILATGDPISNHGSGFRQAGWNWNHFPGTTATVLPVAELKADVRSLDGVSGFEEMLLSDEAFSGAISILGKQGAFGMKLHEHDKYNGSLRARKSVFLFDNRVVALGSNIESALENETHTTLFQVYLNNENNPYFVNGRDNTEFPFQQTFRDTYTALSDGQNNYFFVKNGNVVFRKSLQYSLHEESGEPTSNNFAVASINHGGNFKNGAYEYMILIQPNRREVSAALKKRPYTVLQHDSLAHIVRDETSGTTGYVLFEAGTISADDLLREVNMPSMVMTAETGSAGGLVLSVCDPDLRFYEGPADELFDEHGKRVERSVYSRGWIDNPSGKSTIRLTLAGEWVLEGDSPHFQIAERSSHTTVLLMECQHGFPRETTIRRE